MMSDNQEMTISTASHIEALHEARNLIKDEKCWAREYLALDEHGCMVPPSSGEAVSWCVLGAITCACSKFDEVDPEELSEMVRREIPYGDTRTSLGEFNDYTDTSHEDVLSLLDRTILSIEGGGDARGG